MAALVSANAFGLTPANGGLPATVLSKAVAFFAPWRSSTDHAPALSTLVCTSNGFEVSMVWPPPRP